MLHRELKESMPQSWVGVSYTLKVPLPRQRVSVGHCPTLEANFASLSGLCWCSSSTNLAFPAQKEGGICAHIMTYHVLFGWLLAFVPLDVHCNAEVNIHRNAYALRPLPGDESRYS